MCWIFWHICFDRKSVLKNFIDFLTEISLLVAKLAQFEIINSNSNRNKFFRRIPLMDLEKLYKHSAVARNPNLELDLIEHECFRSLPDMTFNNSTRRTQKKSMTFFVILSTECFNKWTIWTQIWIFFLASYNVKSTKMALRNSVCTMKMYFWKY